MDWYALFVITGKEENVEEWLRYYFKDFVSLIPKRKLIEWKDGKVNHVIKKLFPGYVLVNMEMNSEAYYTIKKIPNLIKLLSSGEYYSKISQEEIVCLRRLLGEGDLVDYSQVYLINSRVIVKSGPLQGMEGLIKSVDKRKNRVKILFPFMGLVKEIDLGIEIIRSV